MFTKEAIKLAKPCYEAIKKISRNYYNSVSKLPGGGLSETEWEWEPEWNELALLNNEIVSIRQHWLTTDKTKVCRVAGRNEKSITVRKEKLTPLLHWERIERVLEEMGYWLEVDKPLNKYIEKSWMKVRARIYEDIARKAAGNGKYVSCAEGKTRQEAVMRAVIELGKEN